MKYEGQITLHSEMCCGVWPQFHDNRGLHGDNNQFWDWGWTINFGKKTKIKNMKIWDTKDNLIYDNSWTFDRQKTCSNKNYIPCPKEISVNDWFEIIYTHEHLKCEIEAEEELLAKHEEWYKDYKNQD